MITIEFKEPQTAFEVRKPFIDACESVARDLGYFATFHQPQQRALSGWPGHRYRERIGNGKHKVWSMHYQEEEPSHARPTVLGKVALASVTIPEIMQFGGFDYGKYGEQSPTYTQVTADVPSVPEAWPPIEPTEEMIALTYLRLNEYYADVRA